MASCVWKQRSPSSPAASPRLLPLLFPKATGAVRPAASAPAAAAASHGAYAAPLLRTGTTNESQIYVGEVIFQSKICER